MLDDISPVQYIEGINDNEEPTSGNWLLFDNYGVAIPYTPSVTYSLSSISILGSPKSLPEPKEHIARVHTDHKDNPSKSIVVEGKLVVPTTHGARWLSIEITQPVVVFSKHKYWLCIEEHPLMFAVGHSEEGEELGLKANPSGQWVSSASGKGQRLMLKFFGRVLPIYG